MRKHSVVGPQTPPTRKVSRSAFRSLLIFLACMRRKAQHASTSPQFECAVVLILKFHFKPADAAKYQPKAAGTLKRNKKAVAPIAPALNQDRIRLLKVVGEVADDGAVWRPAVLLGHLVDEPPVERRVGEVGRAQQPGLGGGDGADLVQVVEAVADGQIAVEHHVCPSKRVHHRHPRAPLADPVQGEKPGRQGGVRQGAQVGDGELALPRRRAQLAQEANLLTGVAGRFRPI
mmetsp:Transcript_12157/g.39955  ORF Transcript_12157/g.39955 Transcript_12157/m.39955 type:complete len:232 (-) Transcript_12157:602-1297(-)